MSRARPWQSAKPRRASCDSLGMPPSRRSSKGGSTWSEQAFREPAAQEGRTPRAHFALSLLAPLRM
eukprot:6425306-Pyramimonas_sp.AAC.1